MTAEELQVLITANTQDLRNEINKCKNDLNGLTKMASKTSSGMLSAFKKLKAGIIALGIGKVIKDSIQIGMDAVESDSLFEVSLGNMSDSVRAWSEELQEALGVNAVAIRKNTGTIYNMTTSMGVASDNALKLSKGVAMLSNDMASFYNISQEQAFDKIQSGLTGMSKPLKDLGILVDDATITQVAYQEGIAEVGAELTEQQKVLARYVAILKQTGNAQGDLARTIDSPANQLRLLKSQVQQLGLAFSNILMPVLQAVLPYITAFTKVVTSAINGLSKLLGIKGSGASKETEKMASSVGGLSGDLDDANNSAKKLKQTLAGFDDMNVIKDTSSDSDSGSSGGGVATAGIDFDLSEYNAHLDWVDSSTNKIVDKINKAFGTIGDGIAQIWNTEPVQAYVDAVITGWQYQYDFITTMATSLWENLQMTWANIELDVTTALENMSLLWTGFWNDVSLGINVWGQPIIDGITKLFNSIWKDAINPACKQISKIWADTSQILLDLWNEYGQDLILNIGEFVTKTIDLFQKIWDDVLEPIVTPFLETLSWLWDKHIKDMVEELGKFIMKLVNGALEIYNKFIAPIVGFILDILSPVWTGLCNLIIGTLGTAFGVISDVIKNVLKVLGGLIDFITGIFTLNWSKTWEGVKEVFSAIWNSLGDVVKGIFNIVIDVMNSVIKALNKISIKVPDWVPVFGGKKWGFNLKEIPKLAQGGVIDKPTLAQIGEAGKEVVMPLENNTGWIKELADQINANNNGGQPYQIIVKIGEDTILDRLVEGINQKSFENNGEVFNI